MSHAHDDVDTNPSSNPTFETVSSARVSRRDMLGGAAGATALAVLGGTATSEALANGHGGGGHGNPYRALKESTSGVD